MSLDSGVHAIGSEVVSLGHSRFYSCLISRLFNDTESFLYANIKKNTPLIQHCTAINIFALTMDSFKERIKIDAAESDIYILFY